MGKKKIVKTKKIWVSRYPGWHDYTLHLVEPEFVVGMWWRSTEEIIIQKNEMNLLVGDQSVEAGKTCLEFSISTTLLENWKP